MGNLGEDFLDFLAATSLKEARNELYNLLENGDDEVNVYYFVPLFNLKSIIADGGIKCRAKMDRDAVDLSGHEVQAKRNTSLRLAQKVLSDSEIDKKIHECINFYWNPLNNTSYAFQRNALLLAADRHNDSHGIVCILEIRLSAFFESDRVYWTTSEQNLASNDFSSYSRRDYENFNWQAIFSIPNDDRDLNKFRSAEFIVFYGDPTLATSDLIPTRFIKRILVPAQYETKVRETAPWIQNQIYPLANTKVFYSKEELLKAEKYLIKTIDYLQKLELPVPLSAEKFCELINTFSNFKELLGCSLTEEYFINKNIARSFHGIGHITRVMFCVHILCYLTDTSWEAEKAAQYATFIHDLCRRDNRMDEEEHGFEAANKYEDFLRQKQISDSLLHSCMNAVAYHCKDDSECPDTDLVWKILKDADSLDRGRFGHPQGLSGIRKKSKGCDVNYLRLDIFRNSPELAGELAWLAYRVASITRTRYTKWSENTFIDLKKEIVRSLEALLRYDILEQSERQVANKMLGHLSVN
jgi:hypothetical protein